MLLKRAEPEEYREKSYKDRPKGLIKRVRLFESRKDALLKKAIEAGFTVGAMKKLVEAIDLAKRSHKKQYRNNGDPYITHPLEVALILMEEFGVKDREVVIAAVLHDVIEDGAKVTLEEISERFGESIGKMVRALTKADERGKLSPRAYADRIINSSQEVRLIKAADALHNTRSTLTRIMEGKISRRELEKVKFYYYNYLSYIRELERPIARRFEEELREIEGIIQDI